MAKRLLNRTTSRHQPRSSLKLFARLRPARLNPASSSMLRVRRLQVAVLSDDEANGAGTGRSWTIWTTVWEGP